MLRIGVKRSSNSSSGSVVEEHVSPEPPRKRVKVTSEERGWFGGGWFGHRVWNSLVGGFNRLILRRRRHSSSSVSMETTSSSSSASTLLSHQKKDDVLSLPVLTSTPFPVPAPPTFNLSPTTSPVPPAPQAPPTFDLSPETSSRDSFPSQCKGRLTTREDIEPSQHHTSEHSRVKNKTQSKATRGKYSTVLTHSRPPMTTSLARDHNSINYTPYHSSTSHAPTSHTPYHSITSHTPYYSATSHTHHSSTSHTSLPYSSKGDDRKQPSLFRPVLSPEVIGPSLLRQNNYNVTMKGVSSSASPLPSASGGTRVSPTHYSASLSRHVHKPAVTLSSRTPSSHGVAHSSSSYLVERVEKAKTGERKEGNTSVGTLSESRRSHANEITTRSYYSPRTDHLFSFLDKIKMEHQRSVEEKRTIAEAIEKKLHFHQHQRMALEDARVARLRGQLETASVDDVKKLSVERLAPLDDVQLTKVAKATGRGAPTDCLSQKFNIRITRGDLRTLVGLQWLNDEVINFYFNMVKDRGGSGMGNGGAAKKIHVFNSFFYPKLSQSGFSGVRRWTRKVDIFSHDLILLPIHLGMHWCLAAIDFNNKSISYYDSLHGSNSACLHRLRDYLVEESRDKKGVEFDTSGWSQLAPRDIPHQENGSDCGVFTCMYARYIAVESPFSFSQEDMADIRQHMIAEILEQKLF